MFRVAKSLVSRFTLGSKWYYFVPIFRMLPSNIANSKRFRYHNCFIATSNKRVSGICPSGIELSDANYSSDTSLCPVIGNDKKNTNNTAAEHFIYFAGILHVLGLKSKEDEETVLITTMKRAVLLIQNGEFKKAEQMLHIALRIAQDEQNQDAITYIYDIMANLALEQEDLIKAEKLFVSVMQRLIASGVPKDDNKILHMSLKLANIYATRKEITKAEDGFQFCVSNLQNKVDKGAEDEDTLLLWAMTLDWYARFLLDMNRSDEAFNSFEKAYNLSVSINGPIHIQSVVLLNDLGTICCLKGDVKQALKYLHEALSIGKQLPDMEDLGSVYVNIGNVYMKEGLYLESKKCCEEGWRSGKKYNNKEVLEEANKCLDELKLTFST